MIDKSDLNITIIAEPEPYVRPHEQFCYPGSDEDADEIERQAEWNEWAWCNVAVSAEWNGLEAETSLGCCTYRDREDFMKRDYDDMVDECLTELEEKLETIRNAGGWIAPLPGATVNVIGYEEKCVLYSVYLGMDKDIYAKVRRRGHDDYTVVPYSHVTIYNPLA